MKYTTNLDLKKPDYTDVVDINDINDNMDTIDSAIQSEANKINLVGSAFSSLKNEEAWWVTEIDSSEVLWEITKNMNAYTDEIITMANPQPIDPNSSYYVELVSGGLTYVAIGVIFDGFITGAVREITGSDMEPYPFDVRTEDDNTWVFSPFINATYAKLTKVEKGAFLGYSHNVEGYSIGDIPTENHSGYIVNNKLYEPSISLSTIKDDLEGKLDRYGDSMSSGTMTNMIMAGTKEKMQNLALYYGSIYPGSANVFYDNNISMDRNYNIYVDAGYIKEGETTSFTLIITMGTTVRTLTFPASVKWRDGEIPDMSTANKTYVLTFLTVDGGTTWLGMFGGEF